MAQGSGRAPSRFTGGESHLQPERCRTLCPHSLSWERWHLTYLIAIQELRRKINFLLTKVNYGDLLPDSLAPNLFKERVKAAERCRPPE